MIPWFSGKRRSVSQGTSALFLALVFKFSYFCSKLTHHGQIPLRKLQTARALRQESQVFHRPVLEMAYQFLPWIQGILHASGRGDEGGVEGEISFREVSITHVPNSNDGGGRRSIPGIDLPEPDLSIETKILFLVGVFKIC